MATRFSGTGFGSEFQEHALSLCSESKIASVPWGMVGERISAAFV